MHTDVITADTTETDAFAAAAFAAYHASPAFPGALHTAAAALTLAEAYESWRKATGRIRYRQWFTHSMWVQAAVLGGFDFPRRA